MGRRRHYQQGPKRRQEQRARILEQYRTEFASQLTSFGRLRGGHSFKTGNLLFDNTKRALDTAFSAVSDPLLEAADEEATHWAIARAPGIYRGSHLGLTDWALKNAGLEAMTPEEIAEFDVVGNTALQAGYLGATKREGAEFALSNPGKKYMPEQLPENFETFIAERTNEILDDMEAVSLIANKEDRTKMASEIRQRIINEIDIPNGITLPDATAGASKQAFHKGVFGDLDEVVKKAEIKNAETKDLVTRLKKDWGLPDSSSQEETGASREAYKLAKDYGLSGEQALAFAREAMKKGAEWRKALGQSQADQYYHEAEYKRANKAAALAKDARALKEAASWNASLEEKNEQNTNILPSSVDGGLIDQAVDKQSMDAGSSALRRVRGWLGRARSDAVPWTEPKPMTGLDLYESVAGKPFEVVQDGIPAGDSAVKYLAEKEVRALQGKTDDTARTTAWNWSRETYPEPAEIDASGRIQLGSPRQRPASAPSILQDLGPLTLQTTKQQPALLKSSVIDRMPEFQDRKQAIGSGIRDTGKLWNAVQQETDARRAIVERDGKEVARANPSDVRRSSSARNTGDVANLVAQPKIDTLGSATNDVQDGLLGAAEEVAYAAQLARSRAVADGTYVGAGHQATPSAASMTDASGDGKMRKKVSAVGANSGSENETYASDIGGGDDDVGDDEGARVICTELVAQGRMATELYHLDLRFAEERLSAAHLRGYHLWAVPLVRWMRRSRRVSVLVAGPALWRAEEIAYLLGERKRANWRGKIVRFLGEPLCRLIGCWAPETDYRKLYEQEINA